MRSRRVLMATALLSAAAVLVGCGGSTESDAGSTTLKVAYDWDLTTGDPAKTGSTGDINLLVNVFDPLIIRDNSGELQPGLATSWELVGDGKTWRFKLREGVKFHNGETFNADSVKFSLERIINDPKSPSSSVHGLPVESITVVDDSTVDITTSVPTPGLPDIVSSFGGLMVPPDYIAENGESEFANSPVGTGPFKVVSWTRGSQMTLEANDDYWGAKPKVETAEVRFIVDPTTRVSALLNNEVDLVNAVPTASSSQIMDASGFELDKADGLRIYYASVAQLDGPLANADVRRALSYATDTEALIEKLMLGYALPIAAPVASTSFGNDAPVDPYPYDVNKAKTLLADAGYPDGFTVDFETQPGLYQSIAQALADMWDDIGVQVNLEVLPLATFEDQYDAGQLPGIWNSGYTLWQGDPTALITSFFRSGMPRAKYFSDVLDGQIETLQSETDPETRLQTMHDVLSTLHDDAPWVYLFQANDLYGRSSDVSWTVPNLQQFQLSTVEIG